jgi:hypothetical protein
MVNKNEEIFDKTLEQQLNTLRVDGGLRRRVLRDLRKLESEIAIKIAEIAPENASRFKATRLRDLLREVRSLIDADFRKIEEELREQLTELASVEATRKPQGKHKYCQPLSQSVFLQQPFRQRNSTPSIEMPSLRGPHQQNGGKDNQNN